MISSHTLTVFRREKTGSRYAQRERAAGRLPGVLYGHGRDPVSIALDTHEALGHFHAGEKIFSISLAGEEPQTVMLKDLQFDYLGTDVIHVDLTRVDLNEEIDANVPIHLVGDPIGLKHAGAILTHPTPEVHVSCTVATLPDHIEVDISELDLGHTLHAGAAPMPEGVTLKGDPEAALATITVSKALVEDEPGEGEAEAVESESAEPEVITEKKGEGDSEKGAKG